MRILQKKLFALILLVCLIASPFLIKLPAVRAQSTETFGNTSSSGLTYDALWFAPTSPLMLNNFTTPSDVDTITAVSCYMDGYPAPIDACAVIYSNNPSTNKPDAVLAQSGDTYVNDTGLTWIDFNTFYLPVSPDTTYWFGVFGSGDFNIVCANSNSWNTQLDYPSNTLSYDTPLSQQSVTSWWYSTLAMAIYVSYTSTSTPTPTDTPTPTASPTPTPTPTASATPTPSPSPDSVLPGYPFTLTSPSPALPTQSNQSSPSPTQSHLNSGILLLIIALIAVAVAITLALSRPRKHRKH